MANEQNLIPEAHKLTLEEQSAGGKASGEARRQKRDLRRALEILLEKTVSKDKDGKEISGAEAMALKQFEKALKGDTRAFEVIRDTAGQQVTQKITVAEVDPEVIAEVENIVLKNK